jgi:hypothetical protein
VSVNGGTPQLVTFPPTGGFIDPGSTTVTLPLAAGSNSITFSNPGGYAPDFDRIDVIG